MKEFLLFLRSLMKKQIEKPVVSSLEKDPFKILVATILSARTKDETLEKILPIFFRRIKSFEDLRNTPIDQLESLIKPIGFYKVKSKKLKELANAIINKYNGKIPDNLNDLTKLPGIGLKTATLYLILINSAEEVCVDTHVHRIANRWGVVNTRTPEETYYQLKNKLPKNILNKINELLVPFGKRICTPQNPKCYLCEYKNLCPYYMKVKLFNEILKKYEFEPTKKIPLTPGTYVLEIFLKEGKKIKFGSKEEYFKKGYYFYVGSAKKGLKERIERHFKNQKKKHWHIDYLLEYGRIKKVYISNKICESEICKELTFLEYIKGFGNSDDLKNPSHLFYLPP